MSILKIILVPLSLILSLFVWLRAGLLSLSLIHISHSEKAALSVRAIRTSSFMSAAM